MKRLFLMALAATLMVLGANAQTSKTTKEKVYDTCEVLPEYPGGIVELMNFISENMVYPAEAVKRGEQGRVLVKFVVEKDGTTSEFEVEKSVTPTLDAAAVATLKKMPRWKPGTDKGKPVRVKFTIPISYRLE